MSNPYDLVGSFSDYMIHKNYKHMIVHVTNLCNFRCEHCYVDFDDPSKKDCQLELYQKLGAEVGSLFWLDIGGGEPFLRKDLAEIVNSFKAKIIHIPTNGFLTERIINTCKKIKETNKAELIIGISIDGLKNTHNKIRKNDKSWDKLWYTFSELKKIPGVSVKICTVISNSNINEIIPLMNFVYEQGIDFHSVILLRGKTLDPNIKLPKIEELNELAPKMFNILEKYSYGRSKLSSFILRNFHRFLWKISIKTIEDNNQIIPCLAGKVHAVIWGNGDLSSCEMLPPVGSIKHNSINEIKKTEAYKNQVKLIEEKKCACTHNCAMLASTFFNFGNWHKLIFQKKP